MSGEQIGGVLEQVRPGRTLHVVTHPTGSDTTLFFIHGAGGNKAQFRFQWQHFADMPVNLVAWDAVGHGQSPQPRDEAAYAGYALLADAQAVFAAHRTRRNIIVAHSYGVRLTLAWLLADQPPGVAGLVLLGAAPLGPMGKRLLPGWLGRLPLPLLELARPILAQGFRKLAWSPSADPALVAAEQRATRGNRLFMMQALIAQAPVIDAALLPGIRQPTTLLTGADDRLVPPSASGQLASVLPNAILSQVPRCGHQIMLEAPDVTNSSIEALLGTS
jgi:pimeloyl-ACP methyl ester carboxylesterase